MRQAASLLMVLLLCPWMAASPVSEATAQGDAARESGDWDRAVESYRRAVRGDAGDGKAWFGLGQALYSLERYDRAIEAFGRALDLGYREQAAIFETARIFAARDDSARALRWLGRLAEAGSTARLRVANTPEFASLAGGAEFELALEALRPCRSPEYRQFDFWLGDWEVTSTRAGAPPSRNRITAIQDGCAILEEYETPNGYTGISLSYYEAGTGRWHQAWMDNQGSPILHSGGFDDGKMVLVDSPAEAEPLNRTTWSPLAGGRVRQHWEISGDAGETWSTIFDGTYTLIRPEHAGPGKTNARSSLP